MDRLWIWALLNVEGTNENFILVTNGIRVSVLLSVEARQDMITTVLALHSPLFEQRYSAQHNAHGRRRQCLNHSRHLHVTKGLFRIRKQSSSPQPSDVVPNNTKWRTITENEFKKRCGSRLERIAKQNGPLRVVIIQRDEDPLSSLEVYTSKTQDYVPYREVALGYITNTGNLAHRKAGPSLTGHGLGLGLSPRYNDTA